MRKASIRCESHIASAEREPITGVWEQSPQLGPGAEPLVRGSDGEADFDHDDSTINIVLVEISLAVGCLNEAANELHSLVFSKHSVSNHAGLLHYCDSSLLCQTSPLMSVLHGAITGFQCLCLQ